MELLMDAVVEETRCKALLDTGAVLSVIRHGLLPGARRKDTRRRLVDARDESIAVYGEVTARVYLESFSTTHTFVEADIRNDVILGMDFLQHHHCVIDLPSRRLCLADTTIKLELDHSPGEANSVAGLHRADLSSDSQEIPRERTKEATKAGLGHDARAPSPKTLPELLQTLWEESTPTLSIKHGRRLKRLLWEFHDTFSLNKDDLGRTSVVRHAIDVGTARPIKQAPRRIPLSKQDATRTEVQRMRDLGIIEPSSSPWASPVVLVDKKDGSTRFCVDYRRVNEVTKKDSNPLPRIDSTLDALAGAGWFSTLDLTNGYWQVEMEPADKEKTAFCMDSSLWQFKVMPFGLCNAPATFTRLMERVLHGLIGHGVLVYLDDIVIYSKTEQEGLELLEKVFQRLGEAKLKLSPKKCRLFKTKTSFLGHVVSVEGVHTDPSKIKDLQDWPRPKCVTDVNSFLGFCAYYRRYVEGFAEIAAPLYRLKEKKRSFVWTTDCEEAFQKLKEHLTTAPILAYPDVDLPFVLDTDASNEGIGAVLSQVCNGQERVIGYYSKRLDKCQRRYCTTRRELLAMVKSIAHFRPYLYGRHFTLRADHSSLQWLINFRDPEGQWARWLQQLQQYDFVILHRPGRSHGNADGLSRRPCDCKACLRQMEREQSTTSENPCAVNVIRFKGLDLAAAQREDPALKPIIDWKEAGQPRPAWEDIAAMSPLTKAYWADWDALELADGLLCRRWEEADGRRHHQLPIVPNALQEEVLLQLHDNPMSGHFGRAKTFQRVRDRFYWKGCRNDVNNWCKRCDICSARKGPKRRQRGPAGVYVVGAPMERVAVDILGPLPLTDQGNRYLLVAMDYFTKWPEVYPLPDQEASTIARVLVEGFFCRFGLPLELHTDQGGNFESRLFAEVCRLLGIEKTRTTPAYPQSDGMVERYNQTLEDSLSMYVSGHQKDWEDYLPYVLMAYRTARHEATGASPCQLMLGRDLRVPVDLVIERPPDADHGNMTGFASDLQAVMGRVHQEARNRLQESATRMKTRYDRKADEVGFQPGDAVWLHNARVKTGCTPKLSRPWEGPYRVMDRITDQVYRIQLTPRSKPRVVNRYRLWRYGGRLEPDWWQRPHERANKDPPTQPDAEDAPDIPDSNASDEDGDGDVVSPSPVATRTGRRVRPPDRLGWY